MTESASSRADRIITELLLHPEMKGREGEIEILKEVVKDVLKKKRHFAVSKEEIEEYFMPFALRLLSV